MVGITCPHVGIGLCWLPKLVWDQSDLLTLFLLGGADYAPTFLTPPPSDLLPSTGASMMGGQSGQLANQLLLVE